MKIIVTGASGGLGSYLNKKLNGLGLNRENFDKEIQRLGKEGTDVIIHCASNSQKDITSETLYKYIYDNIFLTEKILTIPHEKFIFLSSVDVYEKKSICRETDIINITSGHNLYAITKLMSEELIKQKSSNYLILRSVALLGENKRKNSLMKIIDNVPDVSVSPESIFNYVLYEDMLKFINYSIENKLVGVYNVASSKNISIGDAAKTLKNRLNSENIFIMLVILIIRKYVQFFQSLK